jgi:hypothetical protein
MLMRDVGEGDDRRVLVCSGLCQCSVEQKDRCALVYVNVVLSKKIGVL